MKKILLGFALIASLFSCQAVMASNYVPTVHVVDKVAALGLVSVSYPTPVLCQITPGVLDSVIQLAVTGSQMVGSVKAAVDSTRTIHLHLDNAVEKIDSFWSTWRPIFSFIMGAVVFLAGHLHGKKSILNS
jgi:hypothetical protein